MRHYRIALFLALTAAASAAQASNTLDFNLASNAVAADFSTSLTDTGVEGSLGFLHHTDRVDLFDAGLDVVGNASPVGSPLIFGVGGKFFYINPKDKDNGEALAIGAHFRYTWPYFNRFAIAGELYYAPNIVAFQSADRFWEGRLTANYQILRNADAYVGYRYVSASFNSGPSTTLDSSVILGINVTF
ncbi:MAG TPA: YfaZ family outer membrane protein [Gammaproteobacteria bacterium]|jgi:hypothetical protein